MHPKARLAMSEPVPALVTVHVWRVPRRRVPHALLRMATDRAALRKATGLRFAKLLGTGAGRTFTARETDLTRWALLSTWADRAAATAFEDSTTAARWRRIADERWRCELVPLSSRGRWARRQPFGAPVATRWDGPVAAVTRARIVPARAVKFWRAVPAVAADLHDRPGLRAAIGIGESPVGLQGTFSLWDSADALHDYAYRRVAHVAVIEQTAQQRWYAEELFARFAVVASSGSLHDRDPLA